ncbi:hypothetical protein VTN02DRAFT_1331 [Thermoascus thermophilus]
MPQELQDEAPASQAEVDQDPPCAARQGDDRRLVPPAVPVRQAEERPRQVRQKPGRRHRQGHGASGGDQAAQGACLHEEETGGQGRSGAQARGRPEGRCRGRAPHSQGAAGERRGPARHRGEGVDRQGFRRGEAQTEEEDQTAGRRWCRGGNGRRLKRRGIRGFFSLDIYFSTVLGRSWAVCFFYFVWSMIFT